MKPYRRATGTPVQDWIQSLGIAEHRLHVQPGCSCRYCRDGQPATGADIARLENQIAELREVVESFTGTPSATDS